MMITQHGAPLQQTRVVDQFEATDLGAPFKVILHNSVKVSFNESTGEMVNYTIPDLDGLLRAIVITRILHSRKLFGADIKFIRKAVCLKQKELASRIEMSAEHLSRCEASTLTMSPSSEKLLRIFALKTALKLHKMKSCEVMEKLEVALDRLFNSIKPVSVFDVNVPLELHFHRSRKPNKSGDCDLDDDGEWDGELSEAA